MADDLIVTDEAVEDPLVLKRLLSDMIERLSNTVLEVIDPIQAQQFINEAEAEIDRDEKSFNRPGPLTVLTGVSRWYPTKNVTIKRIRANVGIVPVGNDILIQINKNDNILVDNIIIPDGLFLSTLSTVNISLVLNGNDYLTVDILQVGRQPTVGHDLIVNFDYT